VITQNITLDGSVEMLDDWFSPGARPGVDRSDQLAELRRQDETADALLRAGVVDEIRLFVYPAVQGRGRRLFPDGVADRGFRLDRAVPFRSGVVLLTYRKA